MVAYCKSSWKRRLNRLLETVLYLFKPSPLYLPASFHQPTIWYLFYAKTAAWFAATLISNRGVMEVYRTLDTAVFVRNTVWNGWSLAERSAHKLNRRERNMLWWIQFNPPNNKEVSHGKGRKHYVSNLYLKKSSIRKATCILGERVCSAAETHLQPHWHMWKACKAQMGTGCSEGNYENAERRRRRGWVKRRGKTFLKRENARVLLVSDGCVSNPPSPALCSQTLLIASSSPPTPKHRL